MPLTMSPRADELRGKIEADWGCDSVALELFNRIALNLPSVRMITVQTAAGLCDRPVNETDLLYLASERMGILELVFVVEDTPSHFREIDRTDVRNHLVHGTPLSDGKNPICRDRLLVFFRPTATFLEAFSRLPNHAD